MNTTPSKREGGNSRENVKRGANVQHFLHIQVPLTPGEQNFDKSAARPQIHPPCQLPTVPNVPGDLVSPAPVEPVLVVHSWEPI